MGNWGFGGDVRRPGWSRLIVWIASPLLVLALAGAYLLSTAQKVGADPPPQEVKDRLAQDGIAFSDLDDAEQTAVSRSDISTDAAIEAAFDGMPYATDSAEVLRVFLGRTDYTRAGDRRTSSSLYDRIAYGVIIRIDPSPVIPHRPAPPPGEEPAPPLTAEERANLPTEFLVFVDALTGDFIQARTFSWR